MNIGKRCCIKGIKNKTLNIIKQGQELPFTNTVDTVTILTIRKAHYVMYYLGIQKKQTIINPY